MLNTHPAARAAVSASAGYVHAAYAASFSTAGEPLELPAAGGWLIKRAIPNSTAYDAMGCYPLFACSRWSQLGEDLAALQPELVSLALVADPFGDYTAGDLAELFDVVSLFKQHYVVDLQPGWEQRIAENHRRNARKALRDVQVEVVAQPQAVAGEWVELYQNLIRRHQIRGVAAFSPASLACQLAVPGLLLLRASAQGETVGMTLWVIQNDVAYYHLAAYSDRGYMLRSSFALFWRAFEELQGRVSQLGLGAGAGLQSGDDGLTRFKRGWSTGVRPAYFCGKIFQPETYAAIVAARRGLQTAYFPLYRAGEFA